MNEILNSQTSHHKLTNIVESHYNIDLFNTLKPKENVRHFADIFKSIFLNENVWIQINVSPKFVLQDPIENIPALVQIMAWRWSGDKPLYEPVMISLMTHVCVTQCVNTILHVAWPWQMGSWSLKWHISQMKFWTHKWHPISQMKFLTNITPYPTNLRWNYEPITDTLNLSWMIFWAHKWYPLSQMILMG